MSLNICLWREGMFSKRFDNPLFCDEKKCSWVWLIFAWSQSPHFPRKTEKYSLDVFFSEFYWNFLTIDADSKIACVSEHLRIVDCVILYIQREIEGPKGLVQNMTAQTPLCRFTIRDRCNFPECCIMLAAASHFIFITIIIRRRRRQYGLFLWINNRIFFSGKTRPIRWENIWPPSLYTPTTWSHHTTPIQSVSHERSLKL